MDKTLKKKLILGTEEPAVLEHNKSFYYVKDRQVVSEHNNRTEARRAFRRDRIENMMSKIKSLNLSEWGKPFLEE